ncbi:MAG: ferritin-like domain-containing protein [Polyangiaceae bacterium]|nr:ferritin-like domain-containing protein [Polyangiaceae bacterium]
MTVSKHRRFAPPAVLGTGVLLMLASGCDGCTCDNEPETTVIPIAQADYQYLRTLYGADGVPVEDCQLRCLRGDEDYEPPSFGGGGSGGDGQGGQAADGPRNLDVDSCKLTTIEFSQGAVECTFIPDCSSGRRPHRLVAPRSKRRATAASYFARAAHLEAASVIAFVDLARELALHGGAEDLVRASIRSAVEEARHARLMTRLALAAGVRPEPVIVRPFEPRSLEAIALHNAEEGCAGEAFGAALLAAQAKRARSAAFRAVAPSIAADEMRHAAFSIELGSRLGVRLGSGLRRRARDARVEALSRISRDHEHEASRAEADVLGMPSAERVQDIVRSVDRLTARAGA